MTNFERIKNMSIEEMAKFWANDLDGICSCCGITYEEKQNVKCYECLCVKGITRWLNSEVEQ